VYRYGTGRYSSQHPAAPFCQTGLAGRIAAAELANSSEGSQIAELHWGDHGRRTTTLPLLRAQAPTQLLDALTQHRHHVHSGEYGRHRLDARGHRLCASVSDARRVSSGLASSRIIHHTPPCGISPLLSDEACPGANQQRPCPDSYRRCHLRRMTPGLAFFEAGLLRSRNSISILMQCWSGLCILSLLWYVVGFSLSFGKDAGSFIGNPFTYFAMTDVAICYNCDAKDFPHAADVWHANATAPTSGNYPQVNGGIPLTVFASFQMMFAVITPLLITGAFSERVTFNAFVAFIILWSIFVYYPVCHWVWGGGWLSDIGDCEKWDKDDWQQPGYQHEGQKDPLCVSRGGAVDFAGGIVIHTTAGISSAVVAIFLGPRSGFNPSNTSWLTESRPHSIPLATIGAAMLWMGWFGFNAGSAVASNHSAGHTLLSTHIAASTCAVVWMLLSNIDDGKPSIVAALNGAIAGLAGVTPASGFIHSQSAALLGVVLGLASYYGVKLIKGKLKVDDALDVSSVHGITGVVGSLAIGFCAHEDVSGSKNVHGLFFGGGGYLLLYQSIGVGIAAAWAGVFTYLICLLLSAVMEFRVSSETEAEGLDLGLHGETARVLDISPHAISPRHGATEGLTAPIPMVLSSKPDAEATEKPTGATQP
jgi:Amt family ammonium transporter